MKKLFAITIVMLFATFAMGQYQQPGTATITQPGIVTNQTGTGWFNGSSASGGPLANYGGTVGSQGNWAPVAGPGLTPTYTGNVIGVLNYIPNYDVMGAHENGGRGCAGCHAPHNQARGNGGTGAAYGAFADAQGGLWGEDTSAILSTYAGGITFNGGNSRHSGKLTWGNGITLTAANAWTDATYTGVATCLSCHDGDVSQGAMMSGVSYEQTFGLLNGIGIGINSSRAAIALYGNNPIPTFLGTTATTPNGYASTHPVGQTANAGAALGAVLTNANYGLSPAITGASLNVNAIPANTPYGNFVASYYPGALGSLVVVSGSTNFAQNFVTCTTCHNQHNMAVYGGGQRNESTPAGVTQVRTIFFVNGGYNPGAPYDPTHEPSTMRFCQQCHFSFSSEYFGATNVGTAY
ncbi:MAG TPA: hypothetical protein VJX30_16640 [Terriglobales bacterium]|nr:hypothetical protein [Terriglobales bacterium]